MVAGRCGKGAPAARVSLSPRLLVSVVAHKTREPCRPGIHVEDRISIGTLLCSTTLSLHDRHDDDGRLRAFPAEI